MAGDASGLTDAAPARSTLTAVDTLRTELKATETDRGTLVSLPSDVLFDVNKAPIRADARPTLDTLAQLIKAQNSLSITIEGYSDSKATTPATSACPKRGRPRCATTRSRCRRWTARTWRPKASGN